MISKFLSKLKKILFKSSVSPETPIKETPTKKAKKTTKLPKSTKATKSNKSTKSPKTKSKRGDSKKAIETLTSLPGVGAKSAKAFYEAGFKTTKSLVSASEKDLLAVPGVGINLVKKLKNLK